MRVFRNCICKSNSYFDKKVRNGKVSVTKTSSEIFGSPQKIFAIALNSPSKCTIKKIIKCGEPFSKEISYEQQLPWSINNNQQLARKYMHEYLFTDISLTSSKCAGRDMLRKITTLSKCWEKKKDCEGKRLTVETSSPVFRALYISLLFTNKSVVAV